MIKWIYHISDLHIGHDISRRHDKLEVLGKFLHDLRRCPNPDQAIVMICGDIFHFKNRLAAEDITDFCGFLRDCAAFASTFIIPGNHDTNPNNEGKSDLITPIVEETKIPNVCYLRDSRIFK